MSPLKGLIGANRDFSHIFKAVFSSSLVAFWALEGENSSGRPVGFICTTPGTWQTTCGRVMTKKLKKLTSKKVTTTSM